MSSNAARDLEVAENYPIDSQAMSSNLLQLKQAMRATWMAGDFDQIARYHDTWREKLRRLSNALEMRIGLGHKLPIALVPKFSNQRIDSVTLGRSSSPPASSNSTLTFGFSAT